MPEKQTLSLYPNELWKMEKQICKEYPEEMDAEDPQLA